MKSKDISSSSIIVVITANRVIYASFFHFKCDYFLLFLSFVSLVLLIYHILFGLKGFSLNVNMSDCLIIYCCLCGQNGLE